MGSWAGEVYPTQLERQRICQFPGDWVVLGDRVLIDDKGGLAIVPEGGNRCVWQSATLDKALTTEILQSLVKGGVVLISKLSSPSNTSCWGSRKARPGGCVSCQLVEPRAPGPSFRSLVVGRSWKRSGK